MSKNEDWVVKCMSWMDTPELCHLPCYTDKGSHKKVQTSLSNTKGWYCNDCKEVAPQAICDAALLTRCHPNQVEEDKNE